MVSSGCGCLRADRATGILCVAMFSHINIGVRHILPIYSAFAVCGGAVLNRIFQQKRRWPMTLAAGLLIWQIASGSLQHPDYIAYTNELAGQLRALGNTRLQRRR